MQNIACVHWPAVIARICLFSGADHSALQRYSGKKAFALAIGINGCFWCDISFGRAAYRAGRGADIGTDGDVSTARECPHCSVVIEDDDKISHLRANLKAPTGTACPDKGRSGPAMSCACDHHAVAGFATKNKPGLYHADNGETTSVADNSARTALLSHVAEFADARCTTINDALLSGAGCRE